MESNDKAKLITLLSKAYTIRPVSYQALVFASHVMMQRSRHGKHPNHSTLPACVSQDSAVLCQNRIIHSKLLVERVCRQGKHFLGLQPSRPRPGLAAPLAALVPYPRSPPALSQGLHPLAAPARMRRGPIATSFAPDCQTWLKGGNAWLSSAHACQKWLKLAMPGWLQAEPAHNGSIINAVILTAGSAPTSRTLHIAHVACSAYGSLCKEGDMCRTPSLNQRLGACVSFSTRRTIAASFAWKHWRLLNTDLLATRACQAHMPEDAELQYST